MGAKIIEGTGNSLRRLPYAPWCQACVATRATKKTSSSKGKRRQLDFFYTYTGEDVRGDEGPVDKVKERSDQFGTRLVMAASETKAVHVVPVPTTWGAIRSLKNAIKQLPTLFCKALMPLPVFTAIWFFHGFNSLSSRFSRLFAAKSRFFTSKCTLFHGLTGFFTAK